MTSSGKFPSHRRYSGRSSRRNWITWSGIFSLFVNSGVRFHGVMLKGLEIRKGNLGVKLQSIAQIWKQGKIKAFLSVTLGVDHLFIDGIAQIQEPDFYHEA